MRKILVQLAVAVVFLAPFSAFLLFLNVHPAVQDEQPRNRTSPLLAPGQAVTATWLGAGSVLLSDGQTRLLVDGFFSRPSLGHTLFSPLAPDPVRIRRALQLAGIKKLDAVIALHSHYDHALDAPWLADHFDALLVATTSTANAARGAGLPEALIREVRQGSMMQIGAFGLDFRKAGHVPLSPLLSRLMGTDRGIDHPVPPPQRLASWPQGRVLALIARHPHGRILVQGSAGFSEAALQGENLDLALISVGLLGKQSADYRQRYFQEVVASTRPRTVIPTHWDNLFEPLTVDVPSMPLLIDNTPTSIASLRRHCEDSGIELRVVRPLSAVGLRNGRPGPPARFEQGPAMSIR